MSHLHQFLVEQYLKIRGGNLNADIFFCLIQILNGRTQVQLRKCDVVRKLHSRKKRDTGRQVKPCILCIDTTIRIIGLNTSSEVERMGNTTIQIRQPAVFGGTQIHLTLISRYLLLLYRQIVFNRIIDATLQIPYFLCLKRRGTKQG